MFKIIVILYLLVISGLAGFGASRIWWELSANKKHNNTKSKTRRLVKKGYLPN